MHIRPRHAYLALPLSLALALAACKKGLSEQPTATGTGIAGGPTPGPDVVAGPGLAGGGSSGAGTATRAPEFVDPFAPTAQERAVIQGETEAYYKSPRGASGPGATPSPPQ